MAKKKETQKKETTKKSSKIKLTFQPMVASAKVLRVRLVKKEWQEINGRQVEISVPKIKGLPEILEVAKGEVIEVSKTQFEQLQQLGCVETDEEYKKRQQFIDSLGDQHPQKLTYDQIDKDYVNNAGLRDFERLYTDKLIRV